MKSALTLCFHSGNPLDYLVLPEVLDRLVAKRIPVISALQLSQALRQQRTSELPEHVCCLTFDDGQDMDFVDVLHPTHGQQPSFYSIMQAALARHRALDASYQLHATSFVIASPLARAQIQEKEMLGYPWMSDRWWNPAVASGLFHLGSHSFDHCSVSADPVKQRDGQRGNFALIDSHEDANWQIGKARELIDFIAPNPGSHFGTSLFAYPFGHSNSYLRDDYLPNFAHEHGTIAAFTIEPEQTLPDAAIFALPRWVCGMHWQEVSELPLLR